MIFLQLFEAFFTFLNRLSNMAFDPFQRVDKCVVLRYRECMHETTTTISASKYFRGKVAGRKFKDRYLLYAGEPVLQSFEDHASQQFIVVLATRESLAGLP